MIRDPWFAFGCGAVSMICVFYWIDVWNEFTKRLDNRDNASKPYDEWE